MSTYTTPQLKKIIADNKAELKRIKGGIGGRGLEKTLKEQITYAQNIIKGRDAKKASGKKKPASKKQGVTAKILRRGR